MSKQILDILKRKVEEIATYGNLDAETRRNALKEELQFYVLNFIYHHPEYSKWTMYGGSALRIIHGLDRMSVDLDFEIAHKVDDKFLGELKAEIEEHFVNTYDAGADFLTVKIVNSRGLILKFHVGEELSFGQPSKQVHVKIDFNHFVVLKAVHEHWPINHGQLSFVIVAYNMSALMASKLAAIFLRGTRGVGTATFEEKGRDIYDLLWYMGKKIVPDFDYLAAKDINAKDIRTLFDKLTLQMNKVSDENLKQDLFPLFEVRMFIENWLRNWRQTYFRLLDEYQINTVTTLAGINIHQHFSPGTFSFTYSYNTEEGKLVHIRYLLSDYWIDFGEGNLSIKINKELEDKIEFTSDGYSSRQRPEEKLKQYVALFYEKTERYFKKTNRIILGNGIITKTIRLTADNLNPKEQIVLNKSALSSSELDDLLK